MNNAILLKSAKEQILPRLGRYFYAELECGKHSVIVAVKPVGIQVIVQNAANKCWKGLGKSYATAEQAVAAYKTPAIQNMIAAAVRLSGEPEGVRGAVIAAANAPGSAVLQ